MPSAPGDKGDLRLVVQQQFTARERASKIRLQERAALNPALHLIAAEPTEVAPFGFRPVHGAIGLAHQGVRVGAIPGIEGDAEAGSDRDLLIIELNWRRYGVEQLAGDQGGVLGLGQVLDQQRELVAAEPGDGVGLAQAFGEPPPHDGEQAIAGAVSQLVVDCLEAVEVEDHDGGQPIVPPRPRDRAPEAILEQRSIGQPGQLVVLRQPVEALGLAMPGDGIADAALEASGIDPGLIEKIGDAKRHRLDVQLEGAGSGQDDDRRPKATVVGGAHELEPLPLGQPGFEQTGVISAAAHPHQGVGDTARPIDREGDQTRCIQQVAGPSVVLLAVLDHENPDRFAIERQRRIGH